MNLAIKVKCIQTGRCTWDGSETISSNVAARSAIVLALSSKPWHVAFHDSDKRVERSVVSLPPPCCCSNAAGKFERESAAAASKPSAASASPFSMSADTASDVFSTVAITLGGGYRRHRDVEHHGAGAAVWISDGHTEYQIASGQE